jgi:outer membrane protein TolC
MLRAEFKNAKQAFPASKPVCSAVLLVCILSFSQPLVLAAASPGNTTAAPSDGAALAQGAPHAAAAPLPASAPAAAISSPRAPLPPGSAPVVPAADPVKADTIEIQPPRLQALITITKSLDPYKLDAASTRVISFPDVLRIAVTQNLDIRIRQEDVSSKKWDLLSSYGAFLPNTNLGYRYQFIHGKVNIPFLTAGGGANGAAKVNTPFIITNAGFTYDPFQGGKSIYTTLQNRNYLRASRWQQRATLSDTLMECTRRYLNLILAEALLEIRIKAVETSEAQLKLNNDLLLGGKATRLDVLQARTQLSSDRQNLIDQQINRRNAAIELSDLLNLDQGIDLTPSTRIVELHPLISEYSTPAGLLKAAVESRPELKQLRELWLAARKQTGIDRARLMPTIQMLGTIYGLGATLSNSSKTVTESLNPGTLTPTTPGTPGAIPYQQSISRQIAPLYTIGYNITWNFNGMGLTDFSNIQSALAISRERMLELNKRLNSVTNEVRQSYLKSLSAYRKLDETIAKVESSSEELRLAQMRFQYGVGKNIDVLKAQADYTSALIENAQAMITYNISQAQLLHDTGMISTDYLLAKSPLKLE